MEYDKQDRGFEDDNFENAIPKIMEGDNFNLLSASVLLPKKSNNRNTRKSYTYGKNVPLDVLMAESEARYQARRMKLNEDLAKSYEEDGEQDDFTRLDAFNIDLILQAGIPASIAGRFGSTLGTKVIQNTFGDVIAKTYGAKAATALGLTVGDGLLPIGDAIAAGLLISTAWGIARNWHELWQETVYILVQQEPEAQIYTTPTDEQVETSRTTGHGNPEVETGTLPISTDLQVDTPIHTGSELEKPVAEDYVLASKRRNLRGHDKAGGHTRERHIGKADRWLRNRQRNDEIKEVSTFSSNAVGNLTQARFVKMYKKEIREWLDNKKARRPFARDITMDRETGRIKAGKGKIRSTKKAKVVLMKDNSELGYRIHTSYPVP